MYTNCTLRPSCALNQSLHPAHWALGAVIGLTLAPALAALTPRVTTLRRAGLGLRLLGVFLGDIIIANIEVARRILGPEALVTDLDVVHFDRGHREIMTLRPANLATCPP